jgi:hypothetical protein
MSFKLLEGGLPYILEDLSKIDLPGWNYVPYNSIYNTIHTRTCAQFHGIISFLRFIKEHHPTIGCVEVLSIQGPDGIVHDYYNYNKGWGYNIQTTPIRIEWYTPS